MSPTDYFRHEDGSIAGFRIVLCLSTRDELRPKKEFSLYFAQRE